MTRKIINTLLLLLLFGLSFSALALSTTPLDGPYHFFETTQNYSVATHLAPLNSKSSTFGYSGCHGFFDVVTDHLTYDTSVENECMWSWGTQGSDWVSYKNEIVPWSDEVEGPLYSNFSNLLIFAITETNGSQTDVYDKVIAVTPLNGSFALSSWVEVNKNVAGTSDTGNILTDDMQYKLSVALQEPAPAALNNASLDGRYLVRIEKNESGCTDNGVVLENCTEIYRELETEYFEIIFDANGGCTIPVLSKKDNIALLGTNQDKIIQVRFDKISVADGTSNAIGAYWSIIDCTYSVANNKLEIIREELENEEPPSSAVSVIMSNLALSADALYFKYESDVTLNATYSEQASYFGMKMYEGLESSYVEGKTYLVSSIDITNYDYDRMNPTSPDYGDSAGNLSVYDARRYALSFGTSGACTLERTYDFSMAANVNSGALKMITQGRYITPSCSYFIPDTLFDKKLVVTIDDHVNFARSFGTNFSVDLNVIKMNHKSIGIQTAAILPGWENTVDRTTVVSNYGVLLDSAIQDPNTAINNWVDPRYWSNIKSPVMAPIISLILF